LSFRTHALDCVHHIRLLRQESVSQVCHPLNIASHPLHHVWILHESLNTWVPRLLCHSVRQGFALQILIVVHPLLKLNYFQWIGRSGERLRQERVRIKRDRRDQRIQLLRCECSCLLIVCCGRHLLRLRLLRQSGGAQRKTDDGDYAVN
jgi:hypothetical protein